MGRGYNTQFLLFYSFICFQSQSTAEILLLPVAENKRPPYINSTPGFDFDLSTVIAM